MPRVHQKVKSKRGKDYTCRVCSKIIEPGQPYYVFEKRYGGPNRRHVSCGYPRPSELSGRKTALIDDAILDFNPDACESVEDLQAELQAVAEVAREVGQEYEASADNMPESLQYGYQAEAMREVAQELESWADNLEDFEPDEEEPDEDAISGLTGVDWDDPESVSEALEEAKRDWLDQVRDQARSKLEDEPVPEYQG